MYYILKIEFCQDFTARGVEVEKTRLKIDGTLNSRDDYTFYKMKMHLVRCCFIVVIREFTTRHGVKKTRDGKSVRQRFGYVLYLHSGSVCCGIVGCWSSVLDCTKIVTILLPPFQTQ